MADTLVGFQLDVLTALRAREEDTALLQGLRTGDEDAYETLIQRFEQPIFNVISRLLDDPADAADVVQEVFLKVFRNVVAFRGTVTEITTDGADAQVDAMAKKYLGVDSFPGRREGDARIRIIVRTDHIAMQG